MSAYPRPAQWQRLLFGSDVRSVLRLVGVVLAMHADVEGLTHPGVRELVEATRFSEKTVRMALGELRELGMITRVDRGSAHGRRAWTDEYRLSWPTPVPPDDQPIGVDPARQLFIDSTPDPSSLVLSPRCLRGGHASCYSAICECACHSGSREIDARGRPAP